MNDSHADATNASPLVLWIDDERFALTNYKTILERKGLRVQCAYTLADGLALVKDRGNEAALVIVDIMLPLGDPNLFSDTELELTKGGYEAGILLIRRLRERYPELRLVVYSSYRDDDLPRWLESQRISYISKTRHFRTADDFVEMIRDELDGQRPLSPRTLRTFIIHGHDEAAKWELKNFLQNVLGLPEPLILHERASAGKTLIEKFEHEARDRNLVFVILTPDDQMSDESRQARQNVLFELGYFTATLGRQSGRVVLLYKAGVRIPSDLVGVVYIDITDGIEAAGEAIRREIRALTQASV